MLMEHDKLDKIVDEGILELARCINKLIKLEKEINRLTEENIRLKNENQILSAAQVYKEKGGRKMKVRINTHGNPIPVQHGEWVDLYCAEDVVMKKGDFRIISLGVSMEMPPGYYAQVVPRSSTCKNFGIMMANSIGVVENAYCGDNDIWGFPAHAIRDTEIPKGTRICQFCVKKCEENIELEQVEFLGNPDRGGFGSTGTK